ncbi:prepilin-type N-terminal cleavage/methylation domain-containing protein [Pararhizobium sp. LjRoot235]|uniref:GspH/FimT family pseudopilin n=1 Tax=Pararhizobium sp. LjRoot235 TaxID=3342291 RepID=UPI003ECD4E73
MTVSPVPAQHAAGFSLIEMLVVLAIVSVVAGISAVSVQQVRNGKSAHAYARDLSENLTALRYRAMNTGRIQTLEINIEQKTFSDTAKTPTIVIPSTWTMSVTIGRAIAQPKTVPKITFLPDGTSSGAEITLVEPDGDTAYVRVNWLTGLTEYSDHAF